MSDNIQFDTSTTQIGGENITEAVQCDKQLVFNESYTVVGRILKAPSIYASYDLTVIGDIEADEIKIRGNLFVVGNIKAGSISCLKSIICNGNIDAGKIFGDEITAENINCHNLSCNGNVIVRSVIDVQESIKVDKSVLTGEGILGSGQFSAKNAVAAEYFEFDGSVNGKVMELETDATFGELQDTTGDEALTTVAATLSEVISAYLSCAGNIDEDNLVQAVSKVSAIDEKLLSDWEKLINKLVELSYFDSITNFRDYLYVVMAKKLLPKEITEYETMTHVFDAMLVDAEQEIDSLEFHAKTLDDIAYCIKIISLCEADIKIGKDEALDRVLQKLGIKYKTAIKYLR